MLNTKNRSNYKAGLKFLIPTHFAGKYFKCACLLTQNQICLCVLNNCLLNI